MVCPHGQGKEVKSVLSRGRGQFLSDFVWMFFMHGPLYFANYCYLIF